MVRGRLRQFLFAGAAACLAAACSSGPDGADPCAGVVCDQPPADTCKDEQTLLAYDATGSCDPDTGLCVYTSTERSCIHGCADGRCNPPPEGSLELVIPDNTRLCSRYGYGGDSVEHNWELKARVTLNPGTIVFPQAVDEVRADPVSKLEVWPGVDTEKSGAAAFVRTVRQDGDRVLHRLKLVQHHTLDDRNLQVVLAAVYVFEDGQPVQPTVVLDDPTLFDRDGFEGHMAGDWSEVPLISCHFDYLEERSRELVVANGDRVFFTTRGREEEFTWPTPEMIYTFELVEARLERSAQTREVSDFFDLSSSMNHHGCCPGYLVHFDQPLEDIHLIVIDEFSYGQEIHYLDEDGQVLEESHYQDAG